MSENTEQSLTQAYELIENNQLGEARAILEPILAEDMNNVDAWWLYVHAVEDSTRARDALNNVLRLDPNYPGASELLQASEQAAPVTTDVSDDEFTDFDDDLDDIDIDSLLEEDDISSEAFDLDEDDDFADFDDDLEEEDRPRNLRRTLLRLSAVVVLIVILLLVFIVINPFGDDDASETETEPEPTTAVQTIPTEAPTSTTPVEIDDATLDVDSQTAQTDAFINDLLAALQPNLEVVENGGEFRETSLGNTLLFAVCSGAGEQLRNDLSETMTSFAEEVAAVPPNALDAIGVSLVDCDNDEAVLNEIAVEWSAVVDFANNAISLEVYRSNWQPVRE